MYPKRIDFHWNIITYFSFILANYGSNYDTFLATKASAKNIPPPLAKKSFKKRATPPPSSNTVAFLFFIMFSVFLSEDVYHCNKKFHSASQY